MNIELEEVVVQDVSDDALELAAGDAQGGITMTLRLDCVALTGTHCRGGG